MSDIEEPKITQQAFPWSRMTHGWWFVRYSDKQISGLMTRNLAEVYRELFGGVVCKHSQAPKWWQVWRRP